MVRVMVAPLATVVSGVNTRTGATVLPEVWVARVMDAKLVIAVPAVIARALTPVDKTVSALDDILKPAVVAA
jgi:hypothetical protein